MYEEKYQLMSIMNNCLAWYECKIFTSDLDLLIVVMNLLSISFCGYYFWLMELIGISPIKENDHSLSIGTDYCYYERNKILATVLKIKYLLLLEEYNQ